MKEHEEINNNIKDIRNVFIDQLKNGNWKKGNSNLFYNEYFGVEYVRNSVVSKWWVKFERTNFPLSSIMNSLYFYLLYTFYVKPSIKKGKNIIN